jgi:hypothetical protein
LVEVVIPLEHYDWAARFIAMIITLLMFDPKVYVGISSKI